jgi:hypothetical protein
MPSPAPGVFLSKSPLFGLFVSGVLHVVLHLSVGGRGRVRAVHVGEDDSATGEDMGCE